MLSIGEFSRACQVTIKTLRHYDKIDLLKPAYIDAQSGYRYYETEQVPQLLLIQRLKRYGFSLAEIQQLLFTKDKCLLAAKLSAQKNILEQQLAQVSVIMYELEQHLADFERTGDIMSYQNKYQIVLKETEDLAVVGCRQQMSVDDFGQAYGKLFERVAREHCQPTGPVMAFYHDRVFDPDNSDIEVAVPVAAGQADHVISGSLCAVTIHHGAYASMADAYGALTAWIDDNGYEVIAAPYDIYWKNHQNGVSNVEQWETEIRFPIAKR